MDQARKRWFCAVVVQVLLCFLCFFFFFFFVSVDRNMTAGERRETSSSNLEISADQMKSRQEPFTDSRQENSHSLMMDRQHHLIRKAMISSSSKTVAKITGMMLAGPGSYPPGCASKCGRCTPCKPVHVPVVPPGTPVIAEYYPEAWRCKCGNRLYVS